jgi:hypothetical protein
VAAGGGRINREVGVGVMSQLSVRFRVAAPPEAAWDLIADPGHYDAWQSFVGEVVEADGRPGAVGSSFTAIQLVSGRPVENRFVVSESVRPRIFETISTTAGGWTRLRTEIDPDEGGSTISASITYELAGTVLGTVLRRVSGNTVEREFRRSYGRLAELLEPAGPASDPV